MWIGRLFTGWWLSDSIARFAIPCLVTLTLEEGLVALRAQCLSMCIGPSICSKMSDRLKELTGRTDDKWLAGDGGKLMQYKCRIRQKSSLFEPRGVLPYLLQEMIKLSSVNICPVHTKKLTRYRYVSPNRNSLFEHLVISLEYEMWIIKYKLYINKNAVQIFILE